MGLELLRKGSVKDLWAESGDGVLRFRFSDRYSIYDWGEMPDPIPGKGAALARMGRAFFTLLDRAGIAHHALRETEDLAPNELRVREVAMPPKGSSLDTVVAYYAARPEHALVPLEVIFRFGVPLGSSLLKRDPSLRVGQRFDTPRLEFTTKLEPQDRLLTDAEAQALAGLSAIEWDTLRALTTACATLVQTEVARIGLELWDGKFEFAFGARNPETGERSLLVADSIGIDELRLTGLGAPISKEILRQQYAGSSWLRALELAKAQEPKAFRAYCEQTLGERPASLGPERLAAVSALYQVVADCIGAEQVPPAALETLAAAVATLAPTSPPVQAGLVALVVGSGGREHAIANALLADRRVSEVVVTPGNAGMTVTPRLSIAPARSLDALIALVRDRAVRLVVFGPEQPLLDGWSDALRAAFGDTVAVVGASRAAAGLEGSKREAKGLMQLAGVRTAAFDIALTAEQALVALAARRRRGDEGVVIKASGPALGKGVVVTRDFGAAEALITRWFADGAPGVDDGVVLEDLLEGEEVSCFYACVGERFIHLGDACDYKRLNDRDDGPNTGGMGAFSPVPWFSDAARERVERELLTPTLRQLVLEGRPYVGVLFLGLMVKGGEEPWLLEYNTRLGDPETQALLPRLRGVVDLFWALGHADPVGLGRVELRQAGAAVHVVRAAAGYPGTPRSGVPITLSATDAIVTFAGVTPDGRGGLVTSGGRVAGITGLASDLPSARQRAYDSLNAVRFDGAHSRMDIAGDARAVIRVAILASGTGTNARELLRAAPGLRRVRISLLVVDREDSPILEWAPREFPEVTLITAFSRERKAQEAVVLEALATHGIDWCFLAGYLRILSPRFVAFFTPPSGGPARILNLHPALLPEFKGLHAYERAFASGLSRSGVTLHRVDAGMDTGPVVMQASYPRGERDDFDTFVARGRSLEWRLFPEALRTLDRAGDLAIARAPVHHRACFVIETYDGPKPVPVSQWFWMESSQPLPSPSVLAGLAGRLCDGIDQRLTTDIGDWLTGRSRDLQVVVYRPGVTDNPARAMEQCLSTMDELRGHTLRVFSGRAAFATPGEPPPLRANPLIEENILLRAAGPGWGVPAGLEREADTLLNLWRGGGGPAAPPRAEPIPLLEWAGDRLEAESRARTWALTREELEVVQRWFRDPSIAAERRAAGLPEEPLDAELEVLAQTWSEHCKHKIFAAHIVYEDELERFEVDGLFKTFIKAPTERVRKTKSHAVSVFSDNAGIVRYDDAALVCIKVETHNSPSALDPYGGALTGILGVNRDILGTGIGAKPIANTNVLCFGMPDEPGPLPLGLKHPRDILRGVHHGIADGGNKSGIPTVNGAIVFHPAYSGKPLVYCGTVGVLPSVVDGHASEAKRHRPGDLIVMVGGDVGYDGIHGATASSLALDATTPSAMVQIGDPLTQKRVIDLVLAARDLGLYSSITDNGAGGLASSVGEMADTVNDPAGRGGAELFLERVPLKAPGLQPWQILISESQERMTLAVPPEHEAALLALAARHGVRATTVGTFTDTGRFDAHYDGVSVLRLSLALLHRGLPQMRLSARWEGPKPEPDWRREVAACPPAPALTVARLRAALASPTIASKETWVRQYDQEVQAATALKPFEGVLLDGRSRPVPNDAGVIWLGAHGAAAAHSGVGVASGLAPELAAIDAGHMTRMAVDEAVRNLIVTGIDPETIVLLDNYAWPNPLPDAGRGSHLLAQVVRSARALAELVEGWAMPLVSGKDSMKNDFRGHWSDGTACAIHVLPTLLVTAMGRHPDVRRIVKTQGRAGERVYRLGPAVAPRVDAGSWAGRFWADAPFETTVTWPWAAFREGYGWLHRVMGDGLVSAAHDVSDGGTVVALAEMAFLDACGFEPARDVTAWDPWAWFAERPGTVLLAVRSDHASVLESSFAAAGFESLALDHLGTFTDDGLFRVGYSDPDAVHTELLYQAWCGFGPRVRREDADGGRP